MIILTDNIKKNFKNSILFFLPSILTMLIQLVSTPIFAKYLSHYDFAIMGYFGAIQQFFMPVLNLSLFPYYMRGYHERNEEENLHILNTMIKFLSIANLITITLGIIGLLIYFRIADVSFPLFPYILFSLFSSYFTIYISILTMNYRMQKKGIQFALVSSIYPILSISFGLLFVVQFNWAAKGRMGAILVGQMIIGVFAFLKLYNKTMTFDFKIIKNALKLGYPLILVAFLQFPIESIDKIFLERLNNINDFALYNLGLTFSGIMLTFGSTVFQAFEPDFYKYVGNKEWKKLLESSIIVFGFIVIANIIFNIFSKPIISILTSGKYTDAYTFADIAVWSGFFLLLSYLSGIYFVSSHKTKILLINQIILAIFAIGIFAVSIHYWQFIGAVWAKVLINVLYFVIMIISILLINYKNRIKFTG